MHVGFFQLVIGGTLMVIALEMACHALAMWRLERDYPALMAKERRRSEISA